METNRSNEMLVECVYASLHHQSLVCLKIKKESTIAEVIFASGLLTGYPELKLEHVAVGIWGKRKKLDDLVKEGDRVEIYRPLLISPMQKRRERALKKT